MVNTSKNVTGFLHPLYRIGIYDIIYDMFYEQFLLVHVEKGLKMQKRIKIYSAEEIKNFTNAASRWFDDIKVTDSFGAIANAKSILGMLRLDYSKPVNLSCDNPSAIDDLCNTLKTRS